MRNELTVVIPVYNVEKYLSKCIESILNQTLPVDEIILVDDGSKDRSGEIADEYAAIPILRWINMRNNLRKKRNGMLSALALDARIAEKVECVLCCRL